MKYAFMSFSCPQLNLDEMLSLAKRFGYDGIEPRLGSGHKHGVELDASASKRGEIKRKAIDRGIVLCCVATSCRYADPKTAKEQVEETLRCIDLAADVGSSRLRVFGGAIPEGVGRETAIDLVSESLRSVADHAMRRGVTVCMETHDDWCDPDHVAEVMRRVNHSAIAVNWDVMHPVRRAGSTMDRAFQALKPWIKHVHIHDGLKSADRVEYRPMGEGEIDIERAIKLLKSAEYDGYLSGEWIDWEPYEIHLPRELAVMKRYDREA
ncbi:MAG: sugar phosphate isomerase/epimerase family protein [bacterium]